MIRCTNCGSNECGMWLFRDRPYCREHYQDHCNREKEVEGYLFLDALRES